MSESRLAFFKPNSDWSWRLGMVVALLVGRWPSLIFIRQLNTDEGLQIAGAATLRHFPLFWSSVFGTTTGPLDFYALLPFGTLAGGDSYFSARFTGLVLLAAALLFTHQILAGAFDRTTARIATFPLLCFESLSLHPDFLHYSTELLPICLLAAGLCFGLSRYFAKSTPPAWKDFLAGLLLGAVPFAKLQAAPMAALAGLGLLTAAFCIRPPIKSVAGHVAFHLLGGALLPLLVAVVTLAFTTDREGAIVSLLLANLSYAKNGFGDTFTVLSKLVSRLQGQHVLFLHWFIGVGTLSLVLLAWIRRADARSRWLLSGSVLLFAVSIVCIAAPRRPFPHYVQLSVIPLTLIFGTSLGIARQHLSQTGGQRLGRLVSLAALLLPTAFVLFDRGFISNSYDRDPVALTTSAVGSFIRDYVSPGESLAVWGWDARYYVETGTRQATRHAMTDLEILTNPYADLFRDRYTKDFARALPPVFLDASFIRGAMENREMAHDVSLPELGELVRSHYQLVQTLHDVRIFVRRDRLTERERAATD